MRSLPARPVVLRAAVFDRDDRVAAGELLEVAHQALGIERAAFAGEDVFAVAEELARRRVEREGDVESRRVAGRLAGARDEGECRVGRGEVGGESALVADIGVVTLGGERLLERHEYLRAHPHRLGDGAGADRLDHELLEVDRVVGVPPAVDDVHHRHGQGARSGAADIAEERQAEIGSRRLGECERDAEDRIRAEAGFVRRAVEIDQELVEAHLVGRLHAGEGVEYLALDILDRVPHALAAEACGIAVAELHRLVRAGGGAGRNGGTPDGARLEQHLDLDGRVAARIENLAGGDVRYRSHGAPPEWRADKARV